MDTAAPVESRFVPASFRAEVRAEMARQGITQSDLATCLNENQPWLSRKLAGRIAMTVDDADRIASVLGLPLHVLLARAEQAGRAL